MFSFDLADGEAVMILSASALARAEPPPANAQSAGAVHAAELARIEQQRRDALGSRLQRSADAYVVTRNEGRTILAGFPWFTDWGRDTFIAMRGLLIASGRLDDAEVDPARMVEYAVGRHAAESLSRLRRHAGIQLRRRIVVVHRRRPRLSGDAVTRAPRRSSGLQQAVDAILTGYTKGTRFNIQASADDGLLSAGVPGVQLTWMDAKVGDWVVTPRIGKPVEVQALWINALRIAATGIRAGSRPLSERCRRFMQRFVDPSTQALFDIVDVDHDQRRDRPLRSGRTRSLP